ncbi:hypothetical protein VP01_2512g4 [Puccinia sorghi]|uniref:Uncharacterized protein n=1 Tax=Puccinia sorghi TaxID=27349 RepID=A0A0L6V5P3_9BASI|nr:hypothetical protein VP01_2512g4 [Puccinia sorghi]
MSCACTHLLTIPFWNFNANVTPQCLTTQRIEWLWKFLRKNSGIVGYLNECQEETSEYFLEEGEGDQIFTHSNALDNEEESHLQPQFLDKRKKAKKIESQRKKSANQKSKRILDVSTTSKLPHFLSTKSCSIVKFFKNMMGFLGKGFKLPPAPTAKEVTSWQYWVYDHEDMVKKQLKIYIKRKQPQNEAKRKFLISQELQKIKKASLPPQTMKNSCDYEFQSNRFLCITFKLTKPFLANFEWDSLTAATLASNQTKWSSTPQSLIVKSSVNLMVIADYCYQTASVLLFEYSKVWYCFQNSETLSDYKESRNICIAPTKITLTWCSAVSSDLAHKQPFPCPFINAENRMLWRTKPHMKLPLQTCLLKYTIKLFFNSMSNIQQEKMGICRSQEDIFGSEKLSTEIIFYLTQNLIQGRLLTKWTCQ